MTLRAQIHIFFFVRGILFLEFYNVNLNLNLNFPRGEGGPPSPYGSAHAGLFFIYFFRVGAFFPLYLYASDCLNIQFTTFHKCYL